MEIHIVSVLLNAMHRSILHPSLLSLDRPSPDPLGSLFDHLRRDHVPGALLDIDLHLASTFFGFSLGLFNLPLTLVIRDEIVY